MIISKEYLGVILIAIVFSTTLTFFLIGEKPEKLVEILKNEAPSMNSGSDQKYGYSFSIVLRRDFDEVRVNFAWLRGMPMFPNGSATGDSMSGILPSFLKIKMLEEFSSRFGADAERIPQDFFLDRWTDADDVLLLDYSDTMSAGMKSQSQLVHPIYLFVLENGSIVSYYEGITDFFPEREWREVGGMISIKPVRDPRSSGSFEFGIDENRTRYVSAGEKRLYPDLPSLNELPPYGELVFKNIKKDQRLTFMTFIQGRSLGFGNQRELIRVYLDGELELVQFN